jgi:chaperonin GroES
MKVRPLQDRILVRRVAEEEKTKGGIIIPDAAKEKPAEGEVIAVGSAEYEVLYRQYYEQETNKRRR